MFENFFSKTFRFYPHIICWIINKIAVLRKKWELRRVEKFVKILGGKMRIKNNEYVGGTNIEIEIPIKRNEAEHLCRVEKIKNPGKIKRQSYLKPPEILE